MLRRIVVLCALCIAPAAFGLSNRSAVSVTGLDTNPCTPASPCRSFTTAIAATADNGEIIALTSGGYGSFSIDKGITVSGVPGVHAAITTAGDGVTVNTAADDSIILRNLVIIGTMGSGKGIRVNTVSHVRVSNCLIRDVPQGIVAFAGTLTVEHCTVVGVGDGIVTRNDFIETGSLVATITNTLVDGATDGGIIVEDDARVTISHTTVTRSNGAISVAPFSTPGLSAVVVVEKCVISGNQNVAFSVAPGPGETATAYLSDTLFENNNSPVIVAAGGTMYTFGNNEFVNNLFPPNPMSLIATK